MRASSSSSSRTASLKDKISEALSGLLEAQQGALSSDLIEAYEGAKTGVAKGREGAVERLAIKRGELDGEVSSFVQVLKAQIGVYPNMNLKGTVFIGVLDQDKPSMIPIAKQLEALVSALDIGDLSQASLNTPP